MSLHNLRVEIGAGTSIRDAINQCMKLSEDSGNTVYFKFNGVKLYVRKGMSVDFIEAVYKYLLRD